jgi:hypothetical protein
MNMPSYNDKVLHELVAWEKKMSRSPSATNKLAKGIQNKTNNLIPEKVHNMFTEAIKGMIKAVLTGSEYITKEPLTSGSLEERENQVRERLEFYKKAAAVSGAGTGAGGILLGLADFPVLLSLKMKFLFDVAGAYSFGVTDYKERVYILYVFQLAFSSQENRNKVYSVVKNWDNYKNQLPEEIDDFDWRTFQQEYRDYIDIAKMLQLVPGIGAVVGAVANYQLMDQLGDAAMNAFRLRVFNYKKVN